MCRTRLNQGETAAFWHPRLRDAFRYYKGACEKTRFGVETCGCSIGSRARRFAVGYDSDGDICAQCQPRLSAALVPWGFLATPPNPRDEDAPYLETPLGKADARMWQPGSPFPMAWVFCGEASLHKENVETPGFEIDNVTTAELCSSNSRPVYLSL